MKVNIADTSPMEAVNLNNARKDTIAVCVNAEYRAFFLQQLTSKNALIDPQSRLVLLDPEMHVAANLVTCSVSTLASIVRAPLDHVKDKEHPTYAFIYSRNCDESVVRDFLDNGIAAVLSVKGLLVKVAEDERMWFFEFNKAEDTLLIKEQLKPGGDPDSMHVCARHRDMVVTNKRHFLCGRLNRKDNGVDTKSGALNQIAQNLQSQSQLDAAMLTFLKRLITGAPEKTEETATGAESPDGSSADDEAPLPVSAPSRPAPKRRRSSDGGAVGVQPEAFNTLTNDQVKALLLGRMRYRMQRKELRVPPWIRAAFLTMKANPRLVARVEGATVASIFNVARAHHEAAGFLFEDDGGWTAETWATRMEAAAALGRAAKEGESRPMLGLVTEVMRALGVL